MANPFTYDVQQAGYDFDQYDKKGEATCEKFTAEFRSFPWKDQVGKSAGGSEPTISVKNTEAHITDCWVSVIGEPEEYAFLVGIVYPKKTKTLMGLGKEKEVRWVTAYVVEEAAVVEALFKLYFDGKTEELMKQLKQLPEFLSQKAL